MDILPIFSSDSSLYKSILNSWGACEINELQFLEHSPVSIWTIARNYDLKEVYISDTYFSNFITHYKESKKLKIKFIFSVILTVCQDVKNKSEESLSTESRVRIWMKNSEGYKDLLKIYNFSWLAENFYYHNRIDWENLNKLITPNLFVTFDFYNSFLQRNYLGNHNCVPKFITFKPIFEISQCGLPFDNILKEKIREYVSCEGFEVLDVHPIYYYAKEDILAYQTFRCIGNRSKITKPELPHFSSDLFCWEEYAKLKEIEFKNYE